MQLVCVCARCIAHREFVRECALARDLGCAPSWATAPWDGPCANFPGSVGLDDYTGGTRHRRTFERRRV